MKRPGNLNSWVFGDVTGNAARRDRQVATKLVKMAKLENKIAILEKMYEKKLKEAQGKTGLSGWLASWF